MGLHLDQEMSGGVWTLQAQTADYAFYYDPNADLVDGKIPFEANRLEVDRSNSDVTIRDTKMQPRIDGFAVIDSARPKRSRKLKEPVFMLRAGCLHFSVFQPTQSPAAIFTSFCIQRKQFVADHRPAIPSRCS